MDCIALFFALKDGSISQPAARPQLFGEGRCPTSKLVPAVKRPLEASFDPIRQGSLKSRTTLSRDLESGLVSPYHRRGPLEPTREQKNRILPIQAEHESGSRDWSASAAGSREHPG